MSETYQEKLDREQDEKDKARIKKLRDGYQELDKVLIDGRPCRVMELPVSKCKVTLVEYLKTKENFSARRELLSDSTAPQSELAESDRHIAYMDKLASFAVKEILSPDGNKTQFSKEWSYELPDDDTLAINNYISLQLIQKKRD